MFGFLKLNLHNSQFEKNNPPFFPLVSTIGLMLDATNGTSHPNDSTITIPNPSTLLGRQKNMGRINNL